MGEASFRKWVRRARGNPTEAVHPLEERTGKIRPASIRKLGKDGATLTPTEKYRKDKLMKQFARSGRKGYEVSSGSSPEYRAGYDAIDWSKG